MLSLLTLLALTLLPNDNSIDVFHYKLFHLEAQDASIVAIAEYDPSLKVQDDNEIVFLVQKLLKAPVGQQQLKQISWQKPEWWTAANKKKYLIFADFKNNKTDPYLTIECTDELQSYMEGLLKCKDTHALLRFVFPYLRSKDAEVARDSYYTIYYQPDKVLLAARSIFDADQLRTWLSDKTNEYAKTSLFAQLLGYSGTASDIPLLKQLLEQHTVHGQRIVEILFAIVQLDFKQGWEIASKQSDITQGENSFIKRWAVYQVINRTYEIRRAKPDEKTLQVILDRGLGQDDFADITVLFIRQANLWQYTERTLKLYQPDNSPMLKRAIVRLALQSTNPAAKPFLAQLRKDNPELVKDCEELNDLYKVDDKHFLGK